MKKQLLALLLFSGMPLFAQPALEWKRTMGGSNAEGGYSSCSTADGGYAVISGSALSDDGDLVGNDVSGSAWIVRLDSSGNMVWSNTYGGSGDEKGRSIQSTPDGGFIFVSSTNSNDGDVSGNHGGYDIWLVKLDASGNIQWQKCIGGTGPDFGEGVALAADGGYFICGNSQSTDGDLPGNDTIYSDRWGIKTDNLGNIQWATRQGGSSVDTALFCTAAPDGGFVISGFSASVEMGVGPNDSANGFLTKLDAQGNLVWNKVYGGSLGDWLYNLVSLPDGSIVVAGQTESWDGDLTENQGGGQGSSDAWVLKIDSSGNILHSESYGNLADDSFVGVSTAPDNGYVFVGGTTFYPDGDFTGTHGIDDKDGLIAKFNADLSSQWYATPGGSDMDFASTLVFSTDGSMLFSGFTYSSDGDASFNHGGGDMWIGKYAAEPLSKKSFEQTVFAIYPNPAATFIAIKTPDDATADVKIMDVAGRIILKSATNLISVESLAGGTYFLEAACNGMKYRTKFLKK